jgi:hypothetical protein
MQARGQIVLVVGEVDDAEVFEGVVSSKGGIFEPSHVHISYTLL